MKTHGKCYTRTYKTWRAMLDRCNRSGINGYKNYGGRGITVCEQWKSSFENFLKDMGERPDGHVIDRIDVNGNYESGNCRWVTRKQSSRNRRDVVLPFIEGESEKERQYKIHRFWLSRNRDHRRNYMLAYCSKHKKHRQENFRKWSIKNREYRRQYMKQWKASRSNV